MKKAIWRLGPFLGLLYLVAYMDRNNAGFAKLEMTAALQITEAAFGFAAGIFFIGYLLFESIRTLNFDVAGAIVIVIFAIVYSIERLSGWIRSLLV